MPKRLDRWLSSTFMLEDFLAEPACDSNALEFESELAKETEGGSK